MSFVQSFDIREAEVLKMQLMKSIGKVNGELDNLHNNDVLKITSWWKGADVDAFINHFGTTKSSIQNALEEYARDYQRIIDDIVQIKSERTKHRASQFL